MADPDAHKVDLTVVIPAYRCRETLPDQLSALSRQCFKGGWEIVVADNGVDRESREILDRWAGSEPNRLVVDATQARGAGHARNVGTKAARGRLLLFCDADDVVEENWVAAMASALAQHDFVSGTDLPSVGSSELCRSPPTPWPADSEPGHAFRPWARGGNFGVRKQALLDVGGWDASWLRGQDVELSWRLQEHGFRLYRVPDAEVTYRRPETLPKLMRHQYEFGLHAPMLYRRFDPSWSTWKGLARSGREILRTVYRSPRLLSTPSRTSWLVGAAGTVGRALGTLRLVISPSIMTPGPARSRSSGGA